MAIFHHINPKNLDEREYSQLITALLIFSGTEATLCIYQYKLADNRNIFSYKDSNRSNGHATVNVRGPIQWIKNNTVPETSKHLQKIQQLKTKEKNIYRK